MVATKHCRSRGLRQVSDSPDLAADPLDCYSCKTNSEESAALRWAY